MKPIFDTLKKLKIPLLIIGVPVLILAAVSVVLPRLEGEGQPSEIVGISAVNEKTYTVHEEFAPEDFTVTAEYDNGKSEEVEPDAYSLSRDHPRPVGDVTKVTVTLNDNPDISCEVDVRIKRDKVLDIQCGSPEAEGVVATLYSNGELAFTGSGDVMVFSEGECPWMDYDADTLLESVSFGEGVTPTNMNYWFEGCGDLSYCDPIPASAQTMAGTFQDCVSLTHMPDWSGCSDLRNINRCYAGCEKLLKTSPLPEMVTTAEGAFENCGRLRETPDMTNAANLTLAAGMYSGCKNLIDVAMAPAVEDMTEMFLDCINLKEAPAIPASAHTLTGAFSGDLSLATAPAIPKGVQFMGSCFSGCEMLTGDLDIAANAEEFDSIFDGAAVATKLNLTGSSKLLDAYANTSSNGNVRVNGKAPKKSVTSYEDVFHTN